MNKIERIKMVKAMEYIARQINDEAVFERWLIGGVGDGDIEYGELEVSTEEVEKMVQELGEAAECDDAERIKDAVAKAVPTYVRKK